MVVKELAGHSSSKTTEIYIQQSKEKVSKALDMMQRALKSTAGMKPSLKERSNRRTVAF